MRAVLTAHGAPPSVQPSSGTPEAAGDTVIEVRAAPITPLDVLCASGTSYFGAPALPYVPGVQGVGVVRASDAFAPGTRVWFSTPAGMAPGDGSMASHCTVPAADVVPLEHDVPATLVAALGLSAVAAWMALTWRGELRAGDRVLVLGAGGVVGQVGIQVARLKLAGRVVAACRSAEAAERAFVLGADEVVLYGPELAARLTDATGGGADLVLDPVFGAPAEAAAQALRPHGRLVNLGSAAAPTATFDSALLRSRSLRILGYTNTELTPAQRASALRQIVARAAEGNLTAAHETVPLPDIADAWTRQSTGSASGRVVLTM